MQQLVSKFAVGPGDDYVGSGSEDAAVYGEDRAALAVGVKLQLDRGGTGPDTTGWRQC